MVMKIEEAIYEGAIVAGVALATSFGLKKVMKGATREVAVGVGAMVGVVVKKYAMDKGWIKPISM